MDTIRRLDHIGIAVRSTKEALREFQGRLGLGVVHSEEIEQPNVRLTYLDCGNAFLQLVEPLDAESEIARWLDEHGEGIHHLCFGVDDVPRDVSALAGDDAPETRLGNGRGRISAFVPGAPRHGVRVECTEFLLDRDVVNTPGWLKPS
jgi:methylmalonyl-CoA/ethylmalonyl-CoA epimerase